MATPPPAQSSPPRADAGPRRPRLLTDFDGVWTECAEQAGAVERARESELAAIANWPLERVRELLVEVERYVRTRPTEFGWRYGDRLTAFGDEDPFLMHSAILHAIPALAGAGHDGCQECYRHLRAAGHADTAALANTLFHKGSDEFVKRRGHVLSAGAGDALTALLAIADVSFCTNYSSAAVTATWKLHGFEPGVTAQGGHLAIFGDAEKNLLSADPAREEMFAQRSVAVDRGKYLRILEETRPDIVVGDVFSIDLALPLVLRRDGGGFRDLQCVLRKTAFTPPWALEMCASGREPGLRLLGSPTELVDLVRTTASSLG